MHGLLEGRTIVMKGNDQTALTPIYRYVPGDLLPESMWVSARGPRAAERAERPAEHSPG
jgi:hypothetical protein